jgi:GTP-binding protein
MVPVRTDHLVNTSTAIFTGSAPDLASCPDELLPEFAFAGRSNVGKSSLVNLILGKRDLARVSPTPGHTKLLNFYTISGRWRLVDMPGHGYAKVERKERGRFSRSVLEYLENRPNLQCVFVLVDGSLPPQGNDLEFLEWLVDHEVPFVLVFTKNDKVKPAALQANIEALKAHLAEWSDTAPEILTCSSVTGDGRKALLALIDSVLEPEQKLPPEKKAPPRIAPW